MEKLLTSLRSRLILLVLLPVLPALGLAIYAGLAIVHVLTPQTTLHA